MKWLITGANGQLGKCFQKTLLTKEIDFVALSRADLDISNISLVEESIERIKPDVVVNAAAYTNVEQAEVNSVEAFEINQLGAANLAIASKSVRAKFLHFSTDYVFEGNGKLPLKEIDLTEPLSIYGKSKLAGEIEILKEYTDNSLIVRTAWLYSPYGKNFYKTILAKAINSKERIRVVCDQQGQPTSASDLAELSVKAVVKNLAPGIFHGTNAGSCSWFEFAKYIFEIAGEDVARVTPVFTSDIATKVQRPRYSVLDNQKWSEFGVIPLGPWKDSVQKALPDMMQSLSN